jgi:hypothetical protein
MCEVGVLQNWAAGDKKVAGSAVTSTWSVHSAEQMGDLEKYWDSLSHLETVQHLLTVNGHDTQSPEVRFF